MTYVNNKNSGKPNCLKKMLLKADYPEKEKNHE